MHTMTSLGIWQMFIKQVKTSDTLKSPQVFSSFYIRNFFQRQRETEISTK